MQQTQRTDGSKVKSNGDLHKSAEYRLNFVATRNMYLCAQLADATASKAEAERQCGFKSHRVHHKRQCRKRLLRNDVNWFESNHADSAWSTIGKVHSVFVFLRLLNMVKGSSVEYGYFAWELSVKGSIPFLPTIGR